MRQLFFALLVIAPETILSQNLVPNAGFEEYYGCPGNFSENIKEFRAKNWMSANMGTPDLFNGCSEGEADVPYNWAGVSEAYDGQGYAGIYTWMNGDNNYREYLQCKLAEPLRRDSIYHVEFHYKLSSYSIYSVDRIGLALSDSIIMNKGDQVMEIKPTLSVIQDTALTLQTGTWETANLNYKAHGGEQYLIIGNFFDNDRTHRYRIQSRPIQQDMLAESSYYYIDGVEIIPPHQGGEKLSIEIPFFNEQANVNTTYILENIQFEFNSATLTIASYDALNKLTKFLRDNSKLRIQLSGHTDDIGSEAYNDALSLNRATAVLLYLTAQGIERKRMQAFGFGKSEPLLKGTSETIRKANRRVEAKFIQ